MTVEQGAAPARGRWTYLPLPGGAGAPLGGTTTPREELASGGWMNPPEARPGADEDAAMARREAPRAGNGTCTRNKAAPIGAPSPSHFRGGEGKTGLPGASQRIRAMAHARVSDLILRSRAKRGVSKDGRKHNGLMVRDAPLSAALLTMRRKVAERWLVAV